MPHVVWCCSVLLRAVPCPLSLLCGPLRLDTVFVSCRVSAPLCVLMLKRAPTRLELRGEGADQIEAEYQTAKEERSAQQEKDKREERNKQTTKQQQQQQQQVQAQLQATQTPRTPQQQQQQQSAAVPASAAASVRSSPRLNQSTSSFFSVEQ